MVKGKAADEPVRNVRVFKQKEYLEVLLTDDEIKRSSQELANAIQKKDSIQDQLATFKTQKKAEITMCDGEINKNTVLVSSGKEMRMVECEVTLDFNTGKKCTVRLDNGIVVDERPLSTDEKQLELQV